MSKKREGNTVPPDEWREKIKKKREKIENLYLKRR
jgi:hypothetical protein